MHGVDNVGINEVFSGLPIQIGVVVVVLVTFPELHKKEGCRSKLEGLGEGEWYSQLISLPLKTEGHNGVLGGGQ